jgi:hypothetical protein
MPAPVSSNVLPFWLTPLADVVSLLEILDSGTVDLGRLGAKNSKSAAIAPLVEFALAGIILGRGRGSVYGTRRRGIARLAESEWALLPSHGAACRASVHEVWGPDLAATFAGGYVMDAMQGGI